MSTTHFVRLEIHYPPTGETVGLDYKLAIGEKFEDTWKELYDKYLGKPLSERAKVLSDSVDELQTMAKPFVKDMIRRDKDHPRTQGIR